MLLTIIYLLSALAATGLWLLTDALWVWPVGFVGCFLLGLLICFLIVVVETKRSDPTIEHTTDDPKIRTIVKLYAPAVFRLLGCKIHVVGRELMPKEGRFLLVCNHLQDLDPGVILASFPEAQLGFIAKKEVLEMPILNRLMPRLLCQFIDRENDRNALKTILKCISILKDDAASIAVFPEGRITGDDLLHHFRPGVFKMAQKANVPVVVCTLYGTQNIPKNLKKLRRTHIDLHVVGVVPAEELRGVTTVDIAARVHEMMAKDLGPDKVAV